MNIMNHASSWTLPASVVAIGMFDGVHRGHRRVLQQLREVGRLHGLPTVLITFDPHPRAVLRPDAPPVLLSTLEDRMRLLELSECVDYCLVLPFDRQRSAVTADDFVRHTLLGRLGMRALVVGENFVCGSKRQGDVLYLRALGAGGRFEVLPVTMHHAGLGAVPCSSSETRRLIQSGEIASAAAMLERPHEMAGTVMPAREGSHVIDVVVPPQLCVPPCGSYAGAARKRDGGAPWIGATLEVRDGQRQQGPTVRLFTERDAGVRSGDVMSLRFLDSMRRLGNQRSFAAAMAA